jgi:hypothetical protein
MGDIQPDARAFPISLKVAISIPIIGDMSIKNAPPPEEFSYREIPFNEYKHRSKMIDGNGDVQIDYHFAVHGENDNKTILCLEKEQTHIIEHDKPANALGFLFGTDFEAVIRPIHALYEESLFMYFSLLHLYKEGDVYRKHLFYEYEAQEGIVNNKRKISTYSANMATLVRHPMVIEESEHDELSSFISFHSQAYHILKNVVIGDLEFTYHIVDDITNYNNLITPLEVMFLENDRGTKKEMLSKRMGVFIGTTDVEVRQIYSDMKQHYTARSDAVHKGRECGIMALTLNDLRSLVRRAATKYSTYAINELSTNPSMTFADIKSKLIPLLVNEVQIKNDTDFW